MRTIATAIGTLAIVLTVLAGPAAARTPIAYRSLSARVSARTARPASSLRASSLKARIGARWRATRAAAGKFKRAIWSTRRNRNLTNINHDNRPQYATGPATYISVTMQTHDGPVSGNYYKLQGETQERFESRVHAEVYDAARSIANRRPNGGYARVVDQRQASY